MQSIKNIGTHSGHFHVDEVLACAMLTKYVPEYRNAKITRSRDQKVLDSLDLICDVGGTYDPARHRYDHHQREFKETFSPSYTILLSSAGLIYKHFGLEILKNALVECQNGYKLKIQPPPITEQLLQLIYQRIYDNFILSIDAVDNGVNQFENPGQPRYQINTQLAGVVGRLNPMWTEEADENVQFAKAIEVANSEFLSQLRGVFLAWLPAREYVVEALKQRESIDQSGEIIKLGTSVPWKSHLYNLEEEQNIVGKIKFVLYQDQNEGWRVQGVNKVSESFELRQALKKQWRGIKDMAELKKTSGIDDIVFVHASGFIGGARSFESSLRMARESLSDI